MTSTETGTETGMERRTPWYLGVGLAGLAIVALCGGLAGCGSDERGSAVARDDGPQVLTREQPVVYGNDDRQEFWQHPDSELRRLMAQSSVAMIPHQFIRESDDVEGRYFFTGQSLGSYYDLCPDQRFIDQPSIANCSATLIDDDLVLTAGHCVVSSNDCRSFRYVFGYHELEPGRISPIFDEDIFDCEEIVHREERLSPPVLDYAVIRLDRPATPRFRPAPIARDEEPVALGATVFMLGYPSGLPGKIDSGGRVTRNRPTLVDFFEATVDAFEGNSGSGVYDADYRLIGSLSRGAADYRTRPGAGCREVRRLSDRVGTSGAEGITYATQAVSELCERGLMSEARCEGACGDGVCRAGDTAETCPQDCLFEAVPPASFSCDADVYDDGVTCDCDCGVFDPDCSDSTLPVQGCDVGEICGPGGSCIEPPDVPFGWTCPDDLYDNGEACHCACGAPDPDCQDDSLPVRNCPEGAFCNPDGACEFESEVPEDWICEPEFWANGETCNCACGAWDPDCENDGLPVAGCDDGESCVVPGVCESRRPTDPSPNGSSGGCSTAAGVGAGNPVAGFLMLAFGGLFLRRRRLAVSPQQ